MSSLFTSTVVLLLIVVAGIGTAAADVKDAIVKIYTVQAPPDYIRPWNTTGPNQLTGSGCIIKGRKILTNAHVVSDSTFIQAVSYTHLTLPTKRIV